MSLCLGHLDSIDERGLHQDESEERRKLFASDFFSHY